VRAGIRALGLLAALSLLYLPLRAQEATPPAPPPAESPPAPTPPAVSEPPADESVEAEEAEEDEGGYEERVSADNNLSFPVDI